MKRTAFAAALTVMALAAGSAVAMPVNWTMSGSFSDGGSFTGAFTYDADTNVYSGVIVTTTTGGVVTGAVYNAPHAVFSGPNQLTVLTAGGTASGQPLARFTFSAPLTNAGGSVIIGPTTGEGTCNVGCTDFTGGVPQRTATAGLATTAPAPVPTLGEWAMMGFAAALAALGGLFVMRRRWA
jgi:hypothetical protein